MDNSDLPPRAWFVSWYTEEPEPGNAGQYGGPCLTREQAEERAAEMRQRGVDAGRAVRVEISEGVRTWSDELQCFYWRDASSRAGVEAEATKGGDSLRSSKEW